MYPLLLSGLVALTVILERVLVFRRYYKTSPTLLTAVFKQLKGGQLTQAEEECRKVLTPATSIIVAGLEHFNNPLAEMELCMKNRAECWIPILESRIDVIDTVITAAPLMGLLGTITGMMASFEVLSEKGVNEPNAITGGVAEALIATATGLVIALICLVAYNYLTSQVKLFIYEIEAIGSRMIEIRLAADRKLERPPAARREKSTQS